MKLKRKFIREPYYDDITFWNNFHLIYSKYSIYLKLINLLHLTKSSLECVKIKFDFWWRANLISKKLNFWNNFRNNLTYIRWCPVAQCHWHCDRSHRDTPIETGHTALRIQGDVVPTVSISSAWYSVTRENIEACLVKFVVWV